MKTQAKHWTYLSGAGGGVDLERTNGDHFAIVESRSKGRIALYREAARRLRKWADEIETAVEKKP